jgi:hypothetical protein
METTRTEGFIIKTFYSKQPNYPHRLPRDIEFANPPETYNSGSKVYNHCCAAENLI